MRLSIIPSDNKVYVDGVVAAIDCSQFPRYIHALQWDGVEGELEFVPDEAGRKMPNIRIVDLKGFEHWINEHKREIDRIETERIASEKAVEEANRPPATGGMNVFEE